MVNLLWAGVLLLAETSDDTVLEKLDPERRAAVVLALVGLGLLGVFLVVVTMLAGRWARHDRPRRGARLEIPGSSTGAGPRQLPDADVRRGETLLPDEGSEETKA